MLELVQVQRRSPKNKDFVGWQQGDMRGGVDELLVEHFPLAKYFGKFVRYWRRGGGFAYHKLPLSCANKNRDGNLLSRRDALVPAQYPQNHYTTNGKTFQAVIPDK